MQGSGGVGKHGEDVGFGFVIVVTGLRLRLLLLLLLLLLPFFLPFSIESEEV